MTEKMLFRPAEVKQALGIGHTSFWKLVKEGKLETKKLGGCTVVPAESLRRFVESLPSK